MMQKTATCPRCQKAVKSQAIECPFCHTQLKAYGHPGIPLHRATGDEYLCDTCAYHEDDTCTYPKRPYAKECTLYQNIAEMKLEKQQQRTSGGVSFQNWLKRNQSWLLLLSLLIICLIVSILT